MLEYRRQCGTFHSDPKEYQLKIRKAARDGQSWSATNELSDGRIIEVANQPIKGGGWIATHDDITERKQAQARIAGNQ